MVVLQDYIFPKSGEPAVVQSAPEDPQWLFSENNTREPTYLSDKFIPFTTGLTGFLAVVGHNYTYRRPLLSAIPMIVGATALGILGGIWWDQRSDRYFAERDAVLRHYIQLHPEDFPAKERILIGDMMKPWCPIR